MNQMSDIHDLKCKCLLLLHSLEKCKCREEPFMNSHGGVALAENLVLIISCVVH